MGGTFLHKILVQRLHIQHNHQNQGQKVGILSILSDLRAHLDYRTIICIIIIYNLLGITYCFTYNLV